MLIILIPSALILEDASVPSSKSFYFAANAREYNFQSSLTYSGNDIPLVNVSKPVCASVCDSTPGCQGFAFEKSSNSSTYCYLKSNLVNPVKTLSFDFYTAKGARTYNFLPMAAIQSSPDDVIIRTSSEYSCAALCDSISDCLAFQAIESDEEDGFNMFEGRTYGFEGRTYGFEGRTADYSVMNPMENYYCVIKRSLLSKSDNAEMINLFAAAAPAPIIFYVVQNAKFSMDIDSDLGSFSASSTNCPQACSETPGCVGFNIGKSGPNAGFCFLVGVAVGMNQAVYNCRLWANYN